jgi:sortase A
MRLARVLGAIGRSCICAGVLTLLFVAYQLWGTGLREAQAQDRLENQFEELLGESVPTDTTAAPGDAASTTSTTVGPPPAPPEGGDAMAQIRIPKIGVDKIVVEGVTLEDLKRGPGHYTDTPFPGQPGNSAIAGHRTTYGAPFNRIDELAPGDEILVTTLQGSFRYEVSEQQIVSPSQVEVLGDFADNRLTLTACHPKYSASQRIIVVAKLVGPAAPAPPAPSPESGPAEIPGDGAGPDGGDNAAAARADTIDGAGLSGEGASAWPAVMFFVSGGFIWVAAWVLGLVWRKWPSYLVMVPAFGVVLFHFFESFSRLLPANY